MTADTATDFAALLLDTLGHTDTEFVSLGYEDSAGTFRTAVAAPADALTYIPALPATANIFFGVNPTRGPARKRRGRGTENDVTRLAGLWCDLDVKPGGCASLDVARAIIATLSIILGTRPSVTVDSGYGLHAYWPISDGHIAGTGIAAARALIRRWGRLVAVVAATLGAGVDNVYELDRMLRVPDTFNCKNRNGQGPVPVTAHPDTGHPLTIAEVDERLTEVGIVEEDEDRETGGEEISAPSTWQWAEHTCGYTAAMIDNFGTDGPKPGKGRHQWLVYKHVKLACAHRHGCLTEDDHRRACQALGDRFTEIVTTTEPQREPKRFEIAGKKHSALGYGITKTAAKTDEQVAGELGGHTHEPGEPAGTDDTGGEPGDSETVDPVENAIRWRLRGLRIDHEARRRLDAENRPPVHYPPVRDLTTLLDQPDTLTRYRVDAVAPVDARILLSAQWKAGKTTLIGNWVRALVDGDPFLGRFAVNAPANRVVLIDDEMSENMLRAWLRAQNINNTAAVADVITLRGNVAAFNLLDEHCFATWAQRLAGAGCDYLILDCLRPVLDALGLDENHDAGRFLVAFDALLKDAGILDALLVQHMGHTNERARGDSRFQDWPDATWRLVREDDDPASARFFTAYGRDVNVAEGRLSFDPVTLRMRYAPGSRHFIKVDEAATAIIRLLAEDARGGGDGLSRSAVEGALGGEHPRAAVRDALKRVISAADGQPRVGAKRGTGNTKLHHILHPCEECGLPVIDGGPRHLSCPSEGDEDGLP